VEAAEELWQVEPPVFLRDLLATTNARRLEHEQAAAERRPEPPAMQWPAHLEHIGTEEGAQAHLPGMESSGAPPAVHEVLREVRSKLKLSQTQLARKLGVTQAAISMAERGRRPQMAQRLLAAARRLPETPSPTG
jgi:ribosome-binding protein aMBF1 (putative translation factor)